MELLDRYLHAVRFWLPKAHQNDIIEELRDDLSSQIENKESSLGRGITEDELSSILRHVGHPMRVAARYQRQQILIGSALFPLYKFVLKIVMLGYLIPWAVIWVVLTILSTYRASNHMLTVISSWGSFFTNVFIIFGIVTLLFAILERFQSNLAFLDKWDPRKLPRAPKRKERISRTESVFGLVFSVFFVVWWLSLPSYGYRMFGSALSSGAITLNPALRGYYIPFLLPTLVIMAQQCINIFRPEWTWIKPTLMFISDAISFALFQFAVVHYPYVLLNSAAKDAARYARAEFLVNQVFLWSMVCALIVVGIAMIVHGFLAIKAILRLRKEKNHLPVQASQLL
jgi:hypothetical protein